MAVSHVMTAAHLQKFQVKWDNGIPYHFTDPVRVKELSELVSKAAVPLDYGLPTSGTAFLRLNVTVKKNPNRDAWQLSGGAITKASVQESVDDAIANVIKANPDYVVKDTLLTAWVLNEWERYSVVFELVITIGSHESVSHT